MLKSAALLLAWHSNLQQIVKEAKLLFMAANPKGSTPLRLDEECREVGAQIRSGENRIVITSRWAARPDDVIEALLEEKPTILHFSGHGDAEQGLVLEAPSGGHQCVSGKALARLLRAIPDSLRLVVFNACDSLGLAQSAATVTDVAIGMNQPIGDRAAITFATGLYQGFAYGRSFQESFDLALARLAIHDIPENATPELVSREGIDPQTTGIFDAQESSEISSSSGALQLWKKKLAKLDEALALSIDASEVFRLEHQIAEARAKISEIEGQ